MRHSSENCFYFGFTRVISERLVSNYTICCAALAGNKHSVDYQLEVQPMAISTNTFENYKLIINLSALIFNLPWAVCHLAVACTAEGFIELLSTGLQRLMGLTEVVILFTTCFWSVKGSFRFSSCIPEIVDNWRIVQVTRLWEGHFHICFCHES